MNSISQHDLTKICYLYYKEGQTQEEIAFVFGLSRFKISRLLKKARNTGLVSIKINFPADDLTETEVELAKKFRLKEAITVKTNEYDDKMPAAQIGEAGALYLSNLIRRCKILGVAWGRSISHVVHSIKAVEAKDLTVVQITGGMGAIEGTDANALTMELGQKLGAKAHVIQAPVIVRNRVIRDTFLKEEQIRKAIAIAKKADAAIFGIGLPGEDGLLSRAGLLTKKNSAALKKSGAVGAICGRFFDIDGLPCRIELDDRIIGLNLDEIKQISHKVAIAFGPRKMAALLAALRGRYLDVIITDEKTALELLNRS